jgi:hypothetical protein
MGLVDVIFCLSQKPLAILSCLFLAKRMLAKHRAVLLGHFLICLSHHQKPVTWKTVNPFTNALLKIFYQAQMWQKCTVCLSKVFVSPCWSHVKCCTQAEDKVLTCHHHWLLFSG